MRSFKYCVFWQQFAPLYNGRTKSSSPDNGIINTHTKTRTRLSQSLSLSPPSSALLCSLAIMSHAAQNRSDKKSDETGDSIKNGRQTPIGVQTVEAPLSGNVDPVYAAKAQALNDAIQSIGMGRYQVIPSFYLFLLLQLKVPFAACWAPHHSSFYHYIFIFLVGLITSLS